MSELALYRVSDNLEKILNDLCFYEISSDFSSWKLYTRNLPENSGTRTKKEFAALYSKAGFNRYVILGPYDNIQTTKEDLETITHSFFNKPLISQIIRKIHHPLASIAAVGSLIGFGAYYFITGDINMYYLIGLGSAVTIPIAASLAVDSRIEHKLLKLSHQAQHYSFGKVAEKRLITEQKK